MENGFNKGSIWKIWDLHVHSPASYNGDYGKFIANASQCKAEILGINDYCSVQGYEEILNRGGIPNKVLFPVVEFRMHNLLITKKNPHGVKINFHIIFDNNPEIFKSLSNWLASLECYNERGSMIQLGTAQDITKVTFDFDKVVGSLKKLDLYHRHALVWLPYDEYGGIDEIDPLSDGYFKASLINNAHIIGTSTKKQIDFFNWKHEKYQQENYEKWFDRPKPCIKGSDSHDDNYPFGCLKDAKSMPIDRHCWIKASPTFDGLKQIIIEPERVFIGDEPDLLKRVRENRTKFIHSILIKKTTSAELNDIWFDNLMIEFNSGLVAIIGHKGDGKSAIADIIGLCGNTHQDSSYFSFLHNKKFRNPKPINLSERFDATLTWEDGTYTTKRLNEDPDKSLVERVKYIPQNFLERLCVDIESDAFEEELKKIIYSHTPSDKRLGKSSLDELINYKSSILIDEVSDIQLEINNLNLQIVSLEKKATEDYRRYVQDLYDKKKGELNAHNSIKPQKPEAGQSDEKTVEVVKKLELLREKIGKLEEEIEVLGRRKSTLSINQEELKRTLRYYDNIDEQLRRVTDENNEFVQILRKNNIIQNEVFTYTIDTTKIGLQIESIEKEINGISSLIDVSVQGSKAHSLNALNVELKQSQEELNKPAKEQQKYLDDLKGWEAKFKEIVGSPDDEGSLRYFEAQLSYLSEKLLLELAARITERRNLASRIFSKKVDLINIRKELFQPVSKFIDDFKELKARYDVNIDVALEVRSFQDGFFSYITQSRVGSFCGKEEGFKRLSDLIDKTQFNTEAGFIQFIEELMDNLVHDKRDEANLPMDINSQLRKGSEISELYNYIYYADYLQPVYNLNLGTKSLHELSPGERGALLLIFYLILDNDDIPLIIDQPEENLDNESVYHILVHFIKKVKDKRQIVIVTHNPNLAIVCDADQLINMHIEKDNRNRVRFESGAIEDRVINEAAVNILEGTMPAFNNRDSKYLR